MARKGIGLTQAQTSSGSRSRMVAATVEAPGYDSFLATAAYFKDGISMTGINMELLAEISNMYTAAALPGFIGADWNREPATVRATGVLNVLNASLVVAEGCLGTCTAGRGESTID